MQCMIQKGVHVPFLPALIVEYTPLYNWSHPVRHPRNDETEADFMRVSLSHCDTIACNDLQKFGAVMGSRLDPNVDHIINIKLVEGIEFGVGVCDEQMQKHEGEGTKRDFMCLKGGFGYYNYRTKSPRMKPKYPPGLYYQSSTCKKERNEEHIARAGDVLTMVIQRQDVYNNVQPGGGGQSSRYGSSINRRPAEWDVKKERVNENYRRGENGLVSLSYYCNGEDMGFHLRNLRGPSAGFRLCMNYYFVESTVRLLSDWRFISIYNKAQRRMKIQASKQSRIEMRNNSDREGFGVLRRTNRHGALIL